MRIKTYLTLVCLFFCAMTTMNSQTTTQYIGPDGGDWFALANWNNGLPANGNNALIGGGIGVVIGNPLTIDFTITNFGGITANAPLTNDGTISNSGTFDVSATGGLTNNGVFNNFSSSTFTGPANFVNEVGASFTNGGTFTLATTLVNKGSVTNNGNINAAAGTLLTEGSFNNSQTLTTESLTVANGSTFTNNFGSNLYITGAAALLQVDGSFNNLGNVEAEGDFNINGGFSNSSTLVVKGTLTIASGANLNNANGTVTNDGAIQNSGTFINTFQLINNGSFINAGTFTNNNLIDNRSGSTFISNAGGVISMGFGSKIQNAGTFTTNGVFDSFGNVENSNSFTNGGTINSFSGGQLNNLVGSFTNNGILNTNNQANNAADFFNNGTINVNSGSVWANTGNFTNNTTGRVISFQDFENRAAGTLTNNGRFTNAVRTLNEGSFTNNAYLENIGVFTNALGGVLTNNELLGQASGILLNKGSIVNASTFLSDDCSTISNDGSINNNGNLEVHAIIFQRGTLSGMAIDCQGCYVHTSPTSDAPAICQNATFGANIDGDVKVYAPELIAFANFDSCANIVYLANGEGRPVFTCSDIGTTINAHVVLRIPNTSDSLTCTAIITPADVLEPQFNACPKDVVVFTDQAGVAVDWVEPTFSDNCTLTNEVATHAPGDVFPIGITGVTYTSTDSYGNEANCQFRVDVRQTASGGTCTGDATGPVFVGCPNDITLVTTSTSAKAGWVAPSATDNCFPLFINTDFVPGQTFGIGTTTVVYTATDGNGNESTCSFDITVNSQDPCVVDNTPPSFINCPPNIYKPTNAFTGGAVAVWSEPNVFDLCGVASFSGSHVSGNVFPAGTTNVVYSAEDLSGNSSTCNFTVTVGNDPCPDISNPPVFSNCPADFTVQTTGSSAVVNWAAPTASSACQPITISSNFSPGATFQVGLTGVLYQASDVKGNTSTCNFNVIVEGTCSNDTQSPIISNCPSNITVAAVNGFGVANWTAPTATDNCGLVSFSSTYLPGSSFPVGVTVVIYTAGDLSGNGATCEFNVAVVDAPDCTTNASPINLSTNLDAASINLTWNDALNAASYDVYLGTSNPPTNVVASNVSGTSTTVTGLLGGTTYYWYVVPKNAAGSATGCASSTTSFSTAAGSNGGGCNTEALFVVGSTNLNSSDAAVKNRLVSLGFNVTVVSDYGSSTADADGKGIVVISSTVNSGDVNSKFRYVEVPVLCYEPLLYDDMRMTYSSSSYYGTDGYEYKMTIKDASHPIAAGLSGHVQIFNSYETVSYGIPLNSAAVIGNKYGSSSRSLVFAYEDGAGLNGMNAPARRVGFFLQNTSATSLTSNGLKIFDAAVKWAAGQQAPGSACNDGNPNTENDVILADGCTCQGTSCDGALTGLSIYDLNAGAIAFPIANGGTYYIGDLPASYNILATTSGSLESVRFNVSGAISDSYTENVLPYHYRGDTNPLSLGAGNYSFAVAVYSQDNASGISCDQQTVNFTITDTPPCDPVQLVCESNINNNGWVNHGDCTVVVCQGDQLYLSVNPNGAQFSSMAGPNGYSATSSGGNDFLISTSVNQSHAGNYYVDLIDGNGCPGSTVITVVVQAATPVAVCKNLTLQLTSVGQSVQFSGQDLDGGSSAGCNATITSLNASPTSYSQPGTYTATLTVTNSFGLSSTCTSSVTVLAPACDNVTSGGSISKTCQGTSVQLNSVSPPSGGSGAIEYLWISGTTDCNPDNMTPVAGAGSTTTLTIGSVSQTTYFVRCSRRSGCTNWDGESNCLVVEPTECMSTGDCQGALGTGLLREVWYGIYDYDLSYLTNHPDYPNNPAGSYLNAGSTGPVNIGDNYGTRVRGFITPTVSGNYTFYVTGDDFTSLRLSTDSNPNNATEIAGFQGWTNENEFYKYASQKSTSISLQAGQHYYVELLQTELGGGDHWGIHWVKPGSSTPANIPLQHLSPFDTECNDNTVLQTGKIVIEQASSSSWYWVNFDSPFDEAPVVILGPPSANSTEQVIPRIKNVTKNGFEFQLDEWNYLNGYHPVETLFYLAMAKGNHTIDGISFEAGCFSANDNWTTKSFDQGFSGTPVVLTTVASYNDSDAVTPRTENVSSTSFRLKLQEEDLGNHDNETVHYIALNQGSFSHGGANFKSGITANSVTHNWYTVDFGGTFADPGFLASYHTYDGGDVCAIRHQNLSSSNVQVKVEEEQWFDSEVSHTSEAMGWLVFSGSTTLNLAASSIENLSLEAVKGQEFASLYWAHNEGFKVREYILEKSTDGTHFEPIWTVESEGGNAKELYEGYDMEPAIGENIYRVQLVYLDGTIGYSDSKSLYYADLIDFILFPNPANDFVKVNMEAVVGEKDVVLTIYNNLGVLVKEVNIEQVYSKYYQIDLREMKEGHYIVWMNVPGRKPLAKQLVVGKI